MIEITPERPEDSAAVEILLDAAFGADRLSKMSYSYRRGVERLEALCLVARDDATIVGTIRYWPIAIGKTPALLLGPIAVSATHRSDGLGGVLIRRSLALAAELGHRFVVLVGDEPYYGRFGFRPAGDHAIVMARENAARVLALALPPANQAALPSGTIRSLRRAAAE
jgi:predicted N-acetyltransferase YhbS